MVLVEIERTRNSEVELPEKNTMVFESSDEANVWILFATGSGLIPTTRIKMKEITCDSEM